MPSMLQLTDVLRTITLQNNTKYDIQNIHCGKFYENGGWSPAQHAIMIGEKPAKVSWDDSAYIVKITFSDLTSFTIPGDVDNEIILSVITQSNDQCGYIDVYSGTGEDLVLHQNDLVIFIGNGESYGDFSAYRIPTKYSDLLNTPNLATVATTGAYSDLTGQPTIPTKTSDLQNDSGFITDVSDKMNKANGRGTGNLIISGNNDNASVWASKVSGKNAYCGVRDNSNGYSQIYMGSYSDGKRAMYTTNSSGTSAALFTIDNNNKVTEGLLKRRYSLYAGDTFTTKTFNTLCFTLTGGQKELYTFIPMPLLEKLPSLTDLTVGIVLRHADGGYPFIRDGSTYTAVGDSYVYVINNGTKMGGISTIALSNLSEGGFTLRISLTNQLCKSSGSTTAVTNNVPLAGMVTIAGTIST